MMKLPGFRYVLEYEEPCDQAQMADVERDRQIALLQAAVLQLEAGQLELETALQLLLDHEQTGSAAERQTREREAAIRYLGRMRRIDDEFIRAFEEGYDSAERRKQALKERIRRMDEERRARYAAT